VPIDIVDLLKKEFPEQHWIIDGLLITGLTTIAGPPKLGKSWLALNLALSVSMGHSALGVYRTRQGKVLYLALEDNERRIHDRVNKLTVNNATA